MIIHRLFAVQGRDTWGQGRFVTGTHCPKGCIVQGKKLSGTPRSGTHLHGIPYNHVVLEYLYQAAHWYTVQAIRIVNKRRVNTCFFSILEIVCCNTQRGISPLFYCVILKKINKEIRETYSHVNWEIKWTFAWFLRKQKCPLSTRPGKFKRIVSRKNRTGYSPLPLGEQKTNFNFCLSYQKISLCVNYKKH